MKFSNHKTVVCLGMGFLIICTTLLIGASTRLAQASSCVLGGPIYGNQSVPSNTQYTASQTCKLDVYGTLTIGRDSIIHFDESVDVEQGGTLIVERGATLIFEDVNSPFEIYGELHVNGKWYDPVIFTAILQNGNCTPGSMPKLVVSGQSALLDANALTVQCGGGGTNTVPAKPQISVFNGATLRLDNSTVQNGYSGIFALDSHVELTDSTIKDHVGDPNEPRSGVGIRIFAEYQTLNPHVVNNTFTNNATFPLHFIFGDSITPQGGAMGPTTQIADNSGSGNPIMNGIFIEGHVSCGVCTLHNNAMFPYVVWTLTVDPNSELEFERGTVIKPMAPPNNYWVMPGYALPGTGKIHVEENATLIAEFVTITSFWDDSKGGDTNGSNTTPNHDELPEKGDWGHILIDGIASLDGSLISWGGQAVMQMTPQIIIVPAPMIAVTPTGFLSADSVTIKKSKHDGIQTEGTLQIIGGIIESNDSAGIRVKATSDNDNSFALYSAFEDNFIGIFNLATPYFDARYGYWGELNGPSKHDEPYCYGNSKIPPPMGSGQPICNALWDPIAVPTGP